MCVHAKTYYFRQAFMQIPDYTQSFVAKLLQQKVIILL